MNTFQAYAETVYRLRRALRSKRVALAECEADPSGMGNMMLQSLPGDIKRIEDELRLRRKLGSNKPRVGGQWKDVT